MFLESEEKITSLNTGIRWKFKALDWKVPWQRKIMPCRRKPKDLRRHRRVVFLARTRITTCLGSGIHSGNPWSEVYHPTWAVWILMFTVMLASAQHPQGSLAAPVCKKSSSKMLRGIFFLKALISYKCFTFKRLKQRGASHEFLVQGSIYYPPEPCMFKGKSLEIHLLCLIPPRYLQIWLTFGSFLVASQFTKKKPLQSANHLL